MISLRQVVFFAEAVASSYIVLIILDNKDMSISPPLPLSSVKLCFMLRTYDWPCWFCSIPLTVEWSTHPPHDLILAGCHDGMVRILGNCFIHAAVLHDIEFHCCLVFFVHEKDVLSLFCLVY